MLILVSVSYTHLVRNHDLNIMRKAFSIAGYGEEEIEKRFSALYEAFQYGAPPHAGMAPVSYTHLKS